MPPSAAGEFGGRAGELRDLERRQVADAAVEDDPRQNLVLRQRRLRRERDVGRGDPAGHGDDRRHVARSRARDEVDLRVEIADELQRALVEVDALAEDREPAAAQIELADRHEIVRRPGDPQLAAEFDVETAPPDEDLVGRVNQDVGLQRRLARSAVVAPPAPRLATRARSSVRSTRGGGSRWMTSSSIAWALPPSPSATEISVRPRSIVPDSTAAAAGERARDAKRAVEPRRDERSVGIADVVELHRQVGVEAGGDARPSRWRRSGRPRSRRRRRLRRLTVWPSSATSADDVLQPQVGLRIEEARRPRSTPCRRAAARRASRCAVTSKAQRPARLRALRSASRAFARRSGAEPEALTSSPGPVSGTRPEPVDRQALTVRDVERGRASARCRRSRPRRSTVERRDADCRSGSADIPAPRRSNETAGAAIVPRHRRFARKSRRSGPRLPASRSIVRERERRKRDVDVERAVPERNRPGRAGVEPGRRRARRRTATGDRSVRPDRGQRSGGRPAARVGGRGDDRRRSASKRTVRRRRAVR